MTSHVIYYAARRIILLHSVRPSVRLSVRPGLQIKKESTYNFKYGLYVYATQIHDNLLAVQFLGEKVKG